MPGIPDKKSAYYLAKTYYPTLLASGVKIYEYTPGFVHAKVFVSDNSRAVVGTINLDYRSLYHTLSVRPIFTGRHQWLVLKKISKRQWPSVIESAWLILKIDHSTKSAWLIDQISCAIDVVTRLVIRGLSPLFL